MKKDEHVLDELGLKYGTDKASSGHNYLNNYDFFLSSLREKKFIMIEIGGLNGSSLKMWEEYFNCAQIVCIDIDQKVSRFKTDRISVEIGNSGAPDFLESIINKYGKPLVILDDGSHRWDHQRIAFTTLFKHLEPNGFYIIEDIHTSFEPGFSGVDNFSFFELLLKLVTYLQLRGARKTEFEKLNNSKLIAIAKNIETITFISRSCIIKKKIG